MSLPKSNLCMPSHCTKHNSVFWGVVYMFDWKPPSIIHTQTNLTTYWEYKFMPSLEERYIHNIPKQPYLSNISLVLVFISYAFKNYPTQETIIS